MSDRRNLRKCRACGQYIPADEPPWIKVLLTGDEVHWHRKCGRETHNDE